MQTKGKAIRSLKSRGGPTENQGYIYQFPKGHWGWATVNSPVGQSLRESGMIYPETGCKAQQFELISW